MMACLLSSTISATERVETVELRASATLLPLGPVALPTRASTTTTIRWRIWPTPRRAVPVQASPVHQDLHVLELSVTLSKSKGHINLAWLTLVHDWMKLRCEAGAVAQERGGKAQHLHLQIMLRMRIATMDLDALKLELKTLVGWQRGDGSGCYCSVKEFGIGEGAPAS